MSRTVQVFAYGSNMSLQRVAARAASVKVVATGRVFGRRLAFHKIGRDGSGKADAMQSDRREDHVWGVVLSMTQQDKLRLDRCEHRYIQQQVCVRGPDREHDAILYAASPTVVDPSLKPFSWYHRFVVHGATQHGLPDPYIRHIASFETIADPDVQRDRQNSSLLVSPPLPPGTK